MFNSTLKNARILIIDDQESNIVLLESVLEREGYTDLRSTTDPRQVSALFDAFQPDLILLDLRMPHLDGFAVLELLRERILVEGYLPILVLTADVTPETKLHALAVGARDFLTKPVDVAEVSLRIRNLLETRYLHLQQKNQNQFLEENILERTAELHQRVEDLALINMLNAAINQGDDLHKIVALMADELHRIFHCIGTITAFPNPDDPTRTGADFRKSLRIEHIEFESPLASQIEKLAGASIWTIPLKIPMTGDGQFAQVMRAGTPKAINDADTIKAVMAEYTENKLLKGLATPVFNILGIGSMLLIPLISGTEIYGLLEMARTEVTSPAELARVQTIAGQLTSAIGRRRAEEETTLKNKQLAMLNQLSQVLNKLASIPEILERTSNLIGQVFDNQNLYIALYDETTNYVSFPIYWMAGERKYSLEGRPLGSGLTELVIRKRAPVLISDHVQEALAERGVTLIGTMCECYLGVPILVDERAIGVIAVQDYEHTNVYSTNHVELLSTIASQAAVAIENAKLYETSQRELTARKQAEAENTRMALALDIAPSAITVHGFDGRFLYANQRCSNLHGYTREEFIALSLRDIDVPESVNLIVPRMQELVDKGESSFQVEHFRKDGTILPMEVYARVTTWGDVQAILSMATDISERKKAEQAIHESEERFRVVVQTANDAVITMDKHGLIVFWNKAAETIFGFSAGEALGMPVSRITPERFRAQQWYGAEHNLENSERFLSGKIIEAFGLTKDGREFPFEMSMAEWTTQAGTFFTAVIRDISQRKQADERILQSEKKFRELFQVNKDGIAIFKVHPHGPPGTFIELNDAAPKMLGYSRDEMLKLTPIELEPYTTQDQLQARAAEFASQGVVNFETVLQHKDGHPVYTEFTAQLIQFEDQPAIMNIVRDTSERKQRENELHTIAILSTALRSAPSRAEMLPVIVEQLVAILNCETVSIEIIDPLNGDAVTEAAHGCWEVLIGTRQKSGTGINAIISQTRQPYSTNNLKNDSNLAYPEWTHMDIHGGIGAPLIAQDHLFGFIWMGRKSEIVETEVRLFMAVADIAANALHRATLHEQSQKDAAELALAYDSTLEGWAHALELRDQETEGHTRRVMQMTVDLANAMGVDVRELENVRRGALLHDIGKMGIPDSVLLKPGTLNEREWEIMRRHPEYAKQFLESIKYLHPIMDIPYCHHEKWNGTGYPRGLKGAQIPFEARIFAIVDVWDALRSDRPYRLAWDDEKTRKYIIDQSGIHFDPQVVKVFMELLEKNLEFRS